MHIARVLGVACMVFSTVEATVYKVKIRSSDPLVFDPPYIISKVGDYISFNFSNPVNETHNLVESTFDYPCIPKQDMTYKPISKSCTIKVTKSGPNWFYCSVKNHCRSGMVFAINPPSPPQPGYGAFRNRAIPGSAGCDSDLKVSIQKMTGLAGVALLIGLLL